MANRVKTWTAEILTYADLNAEFNNVYVGSIDRSAGRWGSLDDIPVTFGTSQDCSLTWNTTQTTDSLVLGLGASRTVIICDEADKASDFALGDALYPKLAIMSADVAGNLSFYNSGSNSYIVTSVGSVVISAPSRLWIQGAADQDYQVKIQAGTGKAAAIEFYESATLRGTLSTGSTAISILNSSSSGVIITQGTAASVVLGTVIATSATVGFVYLPTCPGTPTGVPTTYSGRVPMVYDSTNHRLYFYDVTWRYATTA